MKKIYLFLILVLSFSLAKSQAITTSTIVSGLQYPIAFDVSNDGRFFITEKGNGSNTPSQNSRIRVYSATGTLLGTFYNLSDSTNSDGERGVLGIALDPDFLINHYVYVYYNHLYNGDERIRIVRLTEIANTGTNPTLIFDLNVADNIPGNHVGGNLHFRPSQPNHIYFTIGDLGDYQTDPVLNYANKLSNPYGKMLRINKNGTVPVDNPYYDNGNPLTTNCDWIWSYGHRNPFDFCFSTVNDSLYCSENGLFTWDEVNLVSKGANYGWPTCEGNYANSSTTSPCGLTGSTLPITVWGSPLPAVTGIMIYSGTWSSINNHMLVADNNNGRIYDCTLGNAPSYNVVTNNVVLGDFTSSGGLTALKQSPGGCIYAMKGGYTTNGQIYELCPVAAGIKENNLFPVSINAFPNPANGTFYIEIDLPESKELEFLLSDMSGHILYSQYHLLKPGKTSIPLNTTTQHPASGMYFIQAKDHTTQQVMATGKLIIE